MYYLGTWTLRVGACEKRKTLKAFPETLNPKPLDPVLVFISSLRLGESLLIDPLYGNLQRASRRQGLKVSKLPRQFRV